MINSLTGQIIEEGISVSRVLGIVCGSISLIPVVGRDPQDQFVVAVSVGSLVGAITIVNDVVEDRGA